MAIRSKRHRRFHQSPGFIIFSVFRNNPPENGHTISIRSIAPWQTCPPDKHCRGRSARTEQLGGQNHARQNCIDPAHHRRSELGFHRYFPIRPCRLDLRRSDRYRQQNHLHPCCTGSHLVHFSVVQRQQGRTERSGISPCPVPAFRHKKQAPSGQRKMPVLSF